MRTAWVLLAVLCTTALAESQSIDCTSQGDGFYVFGCSASFYRCVKGKLHKYSCPSGLMFDSLHTKCNYRNEVEECMRGSTILAKSPAEFSCETRADGLYEHDAVPCDQEFYTCSHRTVHRQSCPYGQVFDPSSKACNYQTQVASCRKMTSMKISRTIAINDQGALPPAAPPAQDQTTQEPTKDHRAREVDGTTAEIDCLTVEDGVYASPVQCVDYFWKCANQRTFKYSCPPGLFYDSGADLCDHKEFVPACGGIRTTTTAAPARDVPALVFDCSTKEDGFYERERCGQSFVSCQAGVARLIGCDAGLVFDKRSNICDYPDECSGVTTTVEPPAFGSGHGSADQLSNDIADPTYDCSSLDDGFYAMGICQQNYVQCSNKKPFIVRCPHQLVFNNATGINACDYANVCRANVQQIPDTSVPVPPTMNDAIAVVQTVATSAPQTNAVELPKPSCASLTDGAYAISRCSQRFFYCTQGQITMATCPSGLLFNPYNGQCDQPERLQTCPTRSNAINTVADTTVVEPFCELLADGFYGTTCSIFFYSCTNRETRKIHCPHRHLFDATSKICRPKEHIPDCAVTDASTNDFPTPAPLPAAQLPFDCSSLTNGMYVKDKCSNKFIECRQGQAIEQSCLGELKFNGQNGLCDHAENNIDCRRSVQPKTQMDVPAVKTPQPSSCEGKPDGYYSIGCSAKFYSCQKGSRYEMACSASLRFAQKQTRCEYEKDVEECQPATATVVQHDQPKSGCIGASCTVRPPTQPEPTAVHMKLQQPTAPQPASTGYEQFCSVNKDGLYTFGCQSRYLSCSNKMAILYSCNAGTILNPETSQCDVAANVRACMSPM